MMKITSRRGKDLILLNNYTYFKMNICTRGTNWRCSTHRSRGCKAYLLINDKEAILEGSTYHNHSELKYMITSTGQYIKL